MMIKIDRTELDKAIQDLSMFEATKEVLADYEVEKEVLEKRQSDLTDRLQKLQGKHATTLVDRENCADDTTKYVKLSKQLKDTAEEMTIINSLQEQVKEEFKALKQKYMPIIRDTYSRDLSVKSEFNVNEVVENIRYVLLQSIADYVTAVRKQEQPIMPIIQDEFLSDNELMEANRSFLRTFDFARNNLSYSESMPNVITRQDVFSACSGNVRYSSKPKDVE